MTLQTEYALATSFAANGDTLSLQRILGHSSITMTMRYAHLSPDHLASALRLSPLAQSRHLSV
jgi:site-specific recombinase XerD